jgi:hypothetical protein
MADLWAHNTSYTAGSIGGVLVCVGVLLVRCRRELTRLRAALEEQRKVNQVLQDRLDQIQTPPTQ